MKPAVGQVPRILLLSMLCCVLDSASAAPSYSGGAGTDAERTLRSRIQKWVSVGRFDRAQEDLTKLFSVSPDDLQGLALQGRMQIESGSIEEAEQTIARLEQLRGGQREAAKLQKLIAIKTDSRNPLYQARQLTRAGRLKEAKAVWDRYFAGIFPTQELAVEYWALVARINPDDSKASTETRKILSASPDKAGYRLWEAIKRSRSDPSDRGAIHVFKSLRDHPVHGTAARKAWRQSMLGLAEERTSLPLLEEYLVQERNDSAVAEKLKRVRSKVAAEDAWQNSPPMQAKRAGLALMAAQRYDEAEPELLKAYEVLHSDEEVAGALGMLYERKGQHSLARGYFQSALRSTRYDQGKWVRMIQVSSYWEAIQNARREIGASDLKAASSYLDAAIAIDAEEQEAHRLYAEIRQAELQVLQPPMPSSDTTEGGLWVVSTAFDYLRRRGTSGISDYSMLAFPVEVEYTAEDTGIFTVQAGSVSLDAGTLSAGETAFGGMAFCQPGCPSSSLSQSSSGRYLHGRYASRNWVVDLGSAPTNFPVSNPVGGLAWQGDVDQVGLSVSYARRSVTGSLLSYAGSIDPYSGSSWGGVVSTGPKLSLSYDLGSDWGFWGNVGSFALTGKNVQSNRRSQLMAGAYRRLVNTEDMEFSVGLNGMYWAHSLNAGEYTSGHGGYYSPAQYISLSVPVDFMVRRQHHTFAAGTSLSYSNSRTDAAPYYPLDTALQTSSGQTYAASSGSGTGYTLRAKWEYSGMEGVIFGVQLSLERSAYYEPDNIVGYVNVALDKPRNRSPHRGPLRPRYKY